ncbi:hypothetical protein MMPV_008858 [Pyropia vietnamensis]
MTVPANLTVDALKREQPDVFLDKVRVDVFQAAFLFNLMADTGLRSDDDVDGDDVAILRTGGRLLLTTRRCPAQVLHHDMPLPHNRYIS